MWVGKKEKQMRDSSKRDAKGGSSRYEWFLNSYK